jgi:hypothetical protein
MPWGVLPLRERTRAQGSRILVLHQLSYSRGGTREDCLKGSIPLTGTRVMPRVPEDFLFLGKKILLSMRGWQQEELLSSISGAQPHLRALEERFLVDLCVLEDNVDPLPGHHRH